MMALFIICIVIGFGLCVAALIQNEKANKILRRTQNQPTYGKRKKYKSQ
jgi:hypothetical protein